ncbi:hypothetical protein D9615_003383 [Tricholomella constricta]|uniref:Arf-GAP domain-containing protein n=1 Tax=Tricholomella constricta TaxID=117010 RepID=A0A8H5HJ80_9AGAR|nr:hypothetical protein D9615_003383 [Tricholomella constricta]
MGFSQPWDIPMVPVNCASIHRKIGTHITKVKSLTMDTWTKEQVETMKSMGNARSNAIYNPNETRHPPPPNLMDAERDSELEQYIRSKYEFKRFLDKSALVSSKLGPSRSASSVTSSGSSRSVSTPLTSAQTSAAKPATTTPLSQTLPQRPSTVATSMTSSRSASQPLANLSSLPHRPPQQQSSHANSSPNPNGVWEDLVSLQAPSASSSLPLQFQMPSQAPLTAQQSSTFPGSLSSYQTSMGFGVNPFQQQHLATNPFTQQQYSVPGMQASMMSAVPPFSPSSALNMQQQQYFSNQSQMQSPMSAPGTHAQNNFFHPQPQPALQIQVPSAGQALFSSNSQGSFMSPPATQGQFMSSSPAQQFASHSPQPLMRTTPQPQMQMQMPSTTPQPQMQMMGQPGQFMSPSPQMGMGMAGVPQGQYMSTTPQPQMQQQRPQQQQQHQQHQQGFYGTQHQMNMQQQGQFGGFPGQPFSAGGYAGGQQWGAM